MSSALIPTGALARPPRQPKYGYGKEAGGGVGSKKARCERGFMVLDVGRGGGITFVFFFFFL